MRIPMNVYNLWIDAIEQQNKAIRDAESHYITASKEDKRVCYIKSTLYRIELPKLPTNEATKKQYDRLINNLKYAIKTNYPDAIAKAGYSEHEHWTPYKMETSKKGGKPYKVFSDNPKYKKKGHIHNFVAGENCHKLANQLYKTEARYISKHFPKLHIAKPSEAIRSTHHIANNYIDWQSSKCRDFGDIENFIEEQQETSFDPLNFRG